LNVMSYRSLSAHSCVATQLMHTRVKSDVILHYLAGAQVDPRLPEAAQARVRARMAAMFEQRDPDAERVSATLAAMYHAVTREGLLGEQPSL